MVEQLSGCGPEIQTALSEDDLNFVAGIMNGVSVRRASVNSPTNSESQINRISVKMSCYEGLEETLKSIARLPFTSQDMLSRREREVQAHKLDGRSNAEIARMLGLISRSVTKYIERAEAKKILHKDRNIPDVNFGGTSPSFELIKVVHFVVSEDYHNFQLIPKRFLSPNESITLIWMCTGRTDKEIATVMETTHLTVQKYMSRASKKLGVSTRGPFITATLAEIMADQQKAETSKRV